MDTPVTARPSGLSRGTALMRCPMYTKDSLLTHDEYKAAEAAFRALPLNSHWSRRAQIIYMGILEVTRGQDIVENYHCEMAVAAES